MHEMSIAQSIFEIIREEMEKCDSNVLKSVRLRIGKMSGIMPDSLSFCFELITEGTDFDQVIKTMKEKAKAVKKASLNAQANSKTRN